MKKFYKPAFIALFAFCAITLPAQNIKNLNDFAENAERDGNGKVYFIHMKPGYTVYESNIEAFIKNTILGDESIGVKKLRTDEDNIGFHHARYQITYQNTAMDNAIIIVHSYAGKVVSVNGDLENFQKPNNSVALTGQQALTYALDKVNAKKYKWENAEEERHMAQALNDPKFTYYPATELVIFKDLNNTKAEASFAYKMNIYAEEPLYRSNVFVDAQSGKILAEHNLLCAADVTATAVTKYSGTKTMTTDNFGANQYRLREVARGNGVETYNLLNGSNYGAAVDFTNTTTTWSVVNVDQAARDAHWGAEVTYDYYFNMHNRNSIDNAGFKLLSYVHYNTAYNNAFWDGQRMTYGDGNGSTFTILTALDVCGHEITHGLTSNTSGLIYSNESGALNESYSDIFGTLVENYGRPTLWDWKIGQDMTPSGNGIRNMSNPNLFNHPDTYLGTNWYTGTGDNGGVHTNSGVSNFWFYLLSLGGSGTNDLSNAYSVTGITMTQAAQIAFRGNTFYFTPSTNYNNARTLTIQSAKDLFGNCSNQVVQTTNAWHAVGVGPVYSSVVSPNFVAPNTSFCSVPANVNFSNTTANGITYTWTYGDGSTSTSTVMNSSHTYTANGTYSVKLKAVGCLSATDSITKTAYITVATPAAPAVTGGATNCGPGTVNLSATGSGQQYWYPTPSATGTPLNIGNAYTTPVISANTTYYVVNTQTNAPVFGGPANTSFGTGANYNSSNAQYLIFDVLQPCTLKTVLVNASVAGNRTIELRNSANAVISNTVVNVPAGLSTITVNIPLPSGTGLRLGLGSTSAINLYRHSAGPSYPYNITGLVNITGSSAGSSYYYFYYNWQVEKAPCTSAATPVTATVTTGPAMSVNSTSICSGNSATLNVSGASSYTWSTGSNATSIVVSPTTTTQYTVNGSNGGCTGSTISTVSVVICTDIQMLQQALGGISIYPNPVNNYFKVSYNSNTPLTVKIYDNTGKLVMEKVITDTNESIEVGKLAQGVYFVEILNSKTRVFNSTIIKQ